MAKQKQLKNDNDDKNINDDDKNSQGSGWCFRSYLWIKTVLCLPYGTSLSISSLIAYGM